MQVYVPTAEAEEREVDWFCEDLQDLLDLIPKKDILFIIGDWNAKVESQEMFRITGKFGLGVQNEKGQGLTEICQENTLAIANTFLNDPRDDSTYGHHHMVNIIIRLIPRLHRPSGEGNGNPLQYSYLGNPMDRGVWLVTVYGVAKSLA